MRKRKLSFRVIPKAPTGWWLYRPKGQYYSMYFEFNPYDDDDYPSVPHGDSLDHRYKIDLRNGDVYEGRYNKIGRLKKSEFERLRHDKKIKHIIVAAQTYYREHHPEITFDSIPWCAGPVFTCGIKQTTTKAIYRLRITMDANRLKT